MVTELKLSLVLCPWKYSFLPLKYVRIWNCEMHKGKIKSFDSEKF